jgi:hypothetical protein
VETGFRRGPVAGLPDAVGELLVRIYPDSISADSHEPLLSADRWPWARSTGAGPADRDERAAGPLLGRWTGGPRRPWVSTRFTPSMWRPWPRAGLRRSPPAELAPAPAAARAAGPLRGVRLPARVAQAVGAPVSQPGPDPRLSDQGDAATTDPIDLSGDACGYRPNWPGCTTWAGCAPAMAVQVPLFPGELAGGFGRAGLWRGTTTTEQERRASWPGLTAHRYSRGLELLAPGTRTNNTGDGPSDYPAADPAGVASFPVAGRPGGRPRHGRGRAGRRARPGRRDRRPRRRGRRTGNRRPPR